MAGQRQKPPEALAFKREGRGRGLTIQAKPERVAPAPPSGLGAYAQGVWRDFWSSWISDAVEYGAHGEALRRWIRCVNEREKLAPLVEAEPTVIGSRGQPIPHPLARRVKDLTAEIQRAEDAFGMTPLSQFRMQLTTTGPSPVDLRRELMAPPKRRPVRA